MAASGSDWRDPRLAESEWVDPSFPSVPVRSVPEASLPVPVRSVPEASLPSVPVRSIEASAPESEEPPDTEFVFGLDDSTAAMWEGDEWVGERIDPSQVITKEEAEVMLSDYLLDKYNSGLWFATDICKIAYFAATWNGGMGGTVARLAKRPGLPSGHYNDHAKHFLGLNRGCDVLDVLSVPSSDAGDGSRIKYQLPVIHPHEHLSQEFAEHEEELKEKLAATVRDDDLPSVYTDHPVVQKHGNGVQPVVLYLDGVPTTKKDGVLGVWMYFAFGCRRHLCAVIKKPRLCKCGCRNWCTLFVLFAWLDWSLSHMADGEHPFAKWDGSPFEDVLRLGLVGCPLLFRACLVAIKGDWKEVAESLGFSTWATKDAPCYSCWCTKANFFFGPSLFRCEQRMARLHHE